MSWAIPIKTAWMKTQANHEPSMQYAKDIYKVASQLNNFAALEIGGAWGFSTLAILAAGAKNLLTIDPNVKAEAYNESRANGYNNHELSCIRSDKFWRENSGTYDLIYVDGSHLYTDVSNDLTEAWKVLNPNGLLMVDDWDHKKNRIADPATRESEYGVALACWEFWRDHPCAAGIEGRVLWFKK